MAAPADHVSNQHIRRYKRVWRKEAATEAGPAGALEIECTIVRPRNQGWQHPSATAWTLAHSSEILQVF